MWWHCQWQQTYLVLLGSEFGLEIALKLCVQSLLLMCWSEKIQAIIAVASICNKICEGRLAPDVFAVSRRWCCNLRPAIVDYFHYLNLITRVNNLLVMVCVSSLCNDVLALIHGCCVSHHYCTALSPSVMQSNAEVIMADFVFLSYTLRHHVMQKEFCIWSLVLIVLAPL